jgi:hypothetical protein
MEEHHRVLEALESSDFAGLRHWLGKHIERSKRALLSDMEEMGDSQLAGRLWSLTGPSLCILPMERRDKRQRVEGGFLCHTLVEL